jgi:hypothetical protein
MDVEPIACWALWSDYTYILSRRILLAPYSRQMWIRKPLHLIPYVSKPAATRYRYRQADTMIVRRHRQVRCRSAPPGRLIFENGFSTSSSAKHNLSLARGIPSGLPGIHLLAVHLWPRMERCIQFCNAGPSHTLLNQDVAHWL